MSKALGFDLELSVPFEVAVSQVKDVLKQKGFGVLTEIDLRTVFREKLGREFMFGLPRRQRCICEAA